MQKVRITDICRATGFSRSTVDRALNERGHVHARTRETIEQAIRELSTPVERAVQTLGKPVDVLLRLGSGLARQMRDTFDDIAQPGDQFIDLFQLNEDSILRKLGEVCADRNRAAIVTVKDTVRIRSLLAKARRSGKIVIALISELDRAACDGFVGIDNKAAGATAAYLIEQSLGNRPSTVGVVVGDHAFRCHEDREIGFRSTLREIAPRTILAGEARGEDNADKTYAAVRRMLEAHPGMGAIYNVSGGNTGLARALQELGVEQDVVAITHELTHVSVPIVTEGTINYAFSQHPHTLLAEAMNTARLPKAHIEPWREIDFGVYTRLNIPRYARLAGLVAG